MKHRYSHTDSLAAADQIHKNALPGPLVRRRGPLADLPPEERAAALERLREEANELAAAAKAAAADRQARRNARRLEAEHRELDRKGVPRTAALALSESPTLENRRILTLSERRAIAAGEVTP